MMKKVYTALKRRLAAMSPAKRVVLISALVLVLTVSSAGAWYLTRLGNVENMFPDLPAGEDTDPDIKSVREAFDNKTLNILLLGFDRNEERGEKYEVFRPDTIMVVSIDLETGKTDLVSIPRDTLVPIYNRRGGKDKINSAYSYGWKYGGAPADDREERHRLGMKYQVETVSIALKGIPVHYYVSVDMEVVREVVDILGGVWYNVEQPVYNNRGTLWLKAGYQHLDGDKFLKYVRGRNYSDGDITRIKNQQNILLAAFDQLKKANKIIRLPQVYASVRKNVETNLSTEQILSLAWFASQNIDKSDIGTHVLKTSYAYGRLSESWTQSYSYLILDQKARAKLIKEIWGIEVGVDPTDELFPPLPAEDPSDDSNWPPADPGEYGEPGQETGDPAEGEPAEEEDPAEPGGSGEPGPGDTGETGETGENKETGDSGDQEKPGESGDSAQDTDRKTTHRVVLVCIFAGQCPAHESYQGDAQQENHNGLAGGNGKGGSPVCRPPGGGAPGSGHGPGCIHADKGSVKEHRAEPGDNAAPGFAGDQGGDQGGEAAKDNVDPAELRNEVGQQNPDKYRRHSFGQQNWQHRKGFGGAELDQDRAQGNAETQLAQGNGQQHVQGGDDGAPGQIPGEIFVHNPLPLSLLYSSPIHYN